jgi:copper chaperone CopZ
MTELWRPQVSIVPEKSLKPGIPGGFALVRARAGAQHGAMSEPRSPNPRFLAAALLGAGVIAVVGFVAWQGSGRDRAQGKESAVAAFEARFAGTGLNSGDAGVVKIAVQGMTCAGCAKSVATEIKKVPGVTDCRVDFEHKVAFVKVDDANVTDDVLLAAVHDAGYDAQVER